MVETSPSKLAVVIGGLALSYTVGTAVASAEPALDSAVNTTCSYEQVIAALNAHDPAAAAQFNASPIGESYLRQFLAAPPDDRRQMAQAIASMPANQPYFGLLQQVFSTCNTF